MNSLFFFSIVIYLVIIAIVAFALYWIIRLGVRHGLRDHSKWMWTLGLSSPQHPQVPEDPAL